MSPREDETEVADPVRNAPREQIGPYKLLQEIGQGGMGVVYMAEQTAPVQRRVALKIIKPGMDTREVIARFEAERQALALMDHPGIAKVLDAGTTPDQRPFFVMELVHGVPITEYCDTQRLETRERLELFVAVCRAVQHAHQKGIIHRDLKPGNILVAEYDQQAVPKVIDFGVAKATSQQLTEKTLFTQFGQIIGTLDYMSPEQSKRNQLDVDTRSDIYSLGIVLYELLTGDTPYDKERLRSAAFDEVLEIIRAEEPPRPSLRLSSSATLAEVAAKRSVEPQRLPALVRGDLDWIVLKALAKERSERYATANELAEDLARHLEHRPISAGPPRLLARSKKFARRHRGGVRAAIAILLLLAVGTFAYIDRQATRRADMVDRSRRAAEALERASLALGRASATPVGRGAEWDTALASRERVDDLVAAGELEGELSLRIAAFAERFDLAWTDRQLADRLEEVLIAGATRVDLASWEWMERSLRELFLEHGFDLENGDPADIAWRIRAHPRAARWTDALELWIGTRGQMATMGGPRLDQATMQPWADAMYAADPDPVRTGLRRLIYARSPPTRQQVDAVVAGVELTDLSPRTLSWLATIYTMAGQPQDMDRVSRLALRHHPDDLMVNFDYGYRLSVEGRWQEAIRMFMRSLALRSDAAGIWESLGRAYAQVEELNQARDALERACELEPDYGPGWVELGEVLLKLEQTSAALAAGERAIDADPTKPAGYGVVGRALMQRGDFDSALEQLENCHALGQDDPLWRGPSASWLEACRLELAGH